MSKGNREKIGQAILETLEQRRMLSTVTFHQGVLTVSGYADAPNELSVHLSRDGSELWGVANALKGEAISIDEVKQIRIYGGEDRDNVKVDSRITIPVYIQTGDGDDYIVAGSGNDTIHAGNGRDFIYAGDGDDVIYGGNGNDVINGGAGNDFIDGGNGSDFIYGGTGHDTIHGASGDDTIYGEGGHDLIDTGVGRSSASGGAGNDTVIGSIGDTLAGGSSGENTVISRPSFTLVNADTNEDIEGFELLVDGATINLAELSSGNLNIRANLGDDFAGSVRFELNGEELSVENAEPFAMARDTDGNYHAWAPEVGEYNLKVTLFSEKDGRGEQLDTAEMNFSIVRHVAPSSGHSVVAAPSSFTLINAATNKPIAGFENLKNGDVIDLAKLPTDKLNIRANMPGDFSGSIAFTHNGKAHAVENTAPYAFNRDTNGNYHAWTPALGSHTVTAIAHQHKDATGTASSPLSVSFTVTRTVVAPPTTPTDSGTDYGSKPGNSGTGTYPSSTPGDVSSVGQAGTGTITAITRNIQQGHSIHVHALNSKLSSGTVLTNTFEWDFGDKGSKYNTLRGWNAAHMYSRAGTYTITLTITNPAGQQTVTKMNVTVAESSRKVIYVSNSGSDTNSGLSQNQSVRTFAKAVSMLTDNTEILFRRGDTFDVPTNAGINTGASNVVIGAYGVGDRPVLKVSGERQSRSIFYINKGARDFTIRDLTFDSIWNKDTDSHGMPTAVSPAGKNITVAGNQFLNLGGALNLNGQPNGVLVQDNVAPLNTGIRTYFMWNEGKDIVVLGNTVANSTREHIVRSTRFERINLQYNDFTNRDLRHTGDQWDTAKGAIVNQRGAYSYMANNKVRGPFGIGPLGDAPGYDKTDRTSWVVAENNHLLGGTMFLNHGAENVMVRGNVNTRETGVAFEVQGYSTLYERGVVNVTFLHNTVVASGDWGNFLRLTGSAKDLRLVGNVYSAPNIKPGQGGTAGIYAATRDLSSFVQIDRNVWPSPIYIHAWAEGGINYVGSSYTSSGYMTPGQWNALAGVGDDFFMNVSFIPGTYQANIGGKVIGAGTLKLAA
jgi:hypothetical protein